MAFFLLLPYLIPVEKQPRFSMACKLLSGLGIEAAEAKPR
jgi:hypothetical protein